MSSSRCAQQENLAHDLWPSPGLSKFERASVDKRFAEAIISPPGREDDEETTGSRTPSEVESSSSQLSSAASVVAAGEAAAGAEPIMPGVAGGLGQLVPLDRIDHKLGVGEAPDMPLSDSRVRLKCPAKPDQAEPTAASPPRASRRVSFAEDTPLEARPTPHTRDLPAKVPLPAYAVPPTALPLAATSMPVKKRPILQASLGWTSRTASRLYPGEPIHKRPSDFLLADPPRVLV